VTEECLPCLTLSLEAHSFATWCGQPENVPCSWLGATPGLKLANLGTALFSHRYHHDYVSPWELWEAYQRTFEA